MEEANFANLLGDIVVFQEKLVAAKISNAEMHRVKLEASNFVDLLGKVYKGLSISEKGKHRKQLTTALGPLLQAARHAESMSFNGIVGSARHDEGRAPESLQGELLEENNFCKKCGIEMEWETPDADKCVQEIDSNIAGVGTPMLRDAARVLSVFSKKWQNDEGREVCIGNDIKKPGMKGAGKFFCGERIQGTSDECGPSAGPQCASCCRLTLSEQGKKIIPRLGWNNEEGRVLCLGNDLYMRGCKGCDKFYCGCPITDSGSDGSCGPSNGPQCAACKRFTNAAAALGRKEWVIAQS